jgi:hypothetical protein
MSSLRSHGADGGGSRRNGAWPNARFGRDGGNTFLFSLPCGGMKEIVDAGDIGEVQHIAARRLNLGLFRKTSTCLGPCAARHLNLPTCRTSAPQCLMPGQPCDARHRGRDDDVSNFAKSVAFVHNSWLDPKTVRQMTVVGSQRMIVYDDMEPLEKLKIYDARVEVPPHYDTFAEFTYSYHYGDAYVPYIKQDEPLKLECQHFLECIREKCTPIANGRLGLEVVRILEAAGESLRQQGSSVSLGAVTQWNNGNGNGHHGSIVPTAGRSVVAA